MSFKSVDHADKSSLRDLDLSGHFIAEVITQLVHIITAIGLARQTCSLMLDISRIEAKLAISKNSFFKT